MWSLIQPFFPKKFYLQGEQVERKIEKRHRLMSFKCQSLFYRTSKTNHMSFFYIKNIDIDKAVRYFAPTIAQVHA